MTVELYRWLGAAINNSLSDLKPVQVKDLEAAFSKLPQEKAKPERLLRSEQAAAAEAAAAEAEMGKFYARDGTVHMAYFYSGEAEDGDGGGDGEGEPMDEDPVDPYDLADPVNITAKLPGNFFELIVCIIIMGEKDTSNLLFITKGIQKVAGTKRST